jgi:hypothetical protein
MPYGVYVHGNDDTAGALRSLHTIAGGMGWTRAAADVSVTGPPTPADLEACQDLGSVLALAAFGG